MSYPSVPYSWTDGTGNVIHAAEHNANFTALVNALSDGTSDINVSNITVNDLTVNGDMEIGNSSSDTLAINAGTVTIDSGCRTFIPRLGIGPSSGTPVCQISGGVLTPTASFVQVQSESGDTDDLSAIDPSLIGDYDGNIIMLKAYLSHVITVKDQDAVANDIYCGADKTLGQKDIMMLVRTGNDVWRLLAYGDN